MQRMHHRHRRRGNARRIGRRARRLDRSLVGADRLESRREQAGKTADDDRRLARQRTLRWTNDPNSTVAGQLARRYVHEKTGKSVTILLALWPCRPGVHAHARCLLRRQRLRSREAEAIPGERSEGRSSGRPASSRNVLRASRTCASSGPGTAQAWKVADNPRWTFAGERCFTSSISFTNWPSPMNRWTGRLRGVHAQSAANRRIAGKGITPNIVEPLGFGVPLPGLAKCQLGPALTSRAALLGSWHGGYKDADQSGRYAASPLELSTRRRIQ